MIKILELSDFEFLVISIRSIKVMNSENYQKKQFETDAVLYWPNNFLISYFSLLKSVKDKLVFEFNNFILISIHFISQVYIRTQLRGTIKHKQHFKFHLSLR